MKHAIPVKFLAIILCAASLLAAVGSGVSIVMLAENGLYEKTPGELYAERQEEEAYFFAEQLAQNYASINLGNCPEAMVANYHYFNYGYYGYTLKDAEGNILDELTLEESPLSVTHEFKTNGSYMKVLNTYPAVQNTVPSEDTGLFIYDAIGEEPTEVYSYFYAWDETSESYGSEVPIGHLEHDQDGLAQFISYDTGMMEPDISIEPTHIAFQGKDGEPIYEISSGSGVGILYTDAVGTLRFTAAIATSQAAPMDAPMETPASAESAAVMASNPDLFSYYDEALGHEVIVEYDWAVMPEYTVTVTLLPGATYDTYSYTLAGVLCGYKNYFPWLLAAGVLVFAVTLVYLCCAAGRKSGSDEVRPTALNRLPLDLYLGAGALAVAGLGLACVEGGSSLFRENTEVGIGFAIACAYGIALICVAFVFAFAAQVKSKNRYWLRNTLCGRALILIVRFIRWCKKKAHTAWPALCSGMKRGWGWFKRTVKAIWKYGCQFVLRAYQIIKTALVRFFSWLGHHIARFFSLLPLTWQWLLTGFLLLFLIFCAVRAGSGGTLLFCLCASIAIILYGAHCFGILLESARKMRQGDLETKVDDRLLIGSFKDFSGELNGLAGVTTVAVQKQLKSERMKTELITNVSHDIKTPLTSIINYVDLMKRPHTDEEHELYLEVLDRQSLRLKKLIEDLIEMSKASTGNIAVDLTRLNAEEAINQALGEFSDKFHSVSLTPVFHHPEEPVSMLADGRLVWRVLSNLFSNAYKYALPGTRLYIDLIQLEDSAVITIKNISKEQLNVDASELMERFVRGDASRNTEGSGLGLNIAKSLVELQMGRMELMVDGDLFKVTLVFPLA